MRDIVRPISTLFTPVFCTPFFAYISSPRSSENMRDSPAVSGTSGVSRASTPAVSTLRVTTFVVVPALRRVTPLILLVVREAGADTIVVEVAEVIAPLLFHRVNAVSVLSAHSTTYSICEVEEVRSSRVSFVATRCIIGLKVLTS